MAGLVVVLLIIVLVGVAVVVVVDGGTGGRVATLYPRLLALKRR